MKLILNPLNWPVIRDLKWPHFSKDNIFCWRKLCADRFQFLEESFNTEEIKFDGQSSGPSPVMTAKNEPPHSRYLDDADSFVFANWCIEDVMEDGEEEEERREGSFGGRAEDSLSLMSGVSDTIFYDSDFLEYGLELSGIGGLRGLFGSSFNNSLSASSSSASFNSSSSSSFPSFTGKIF
ncbi:hypothetical protein TYRP_011924 [Tyrophagus putrescentiae]|nr:hypothetical protein TYRP_022355 [Tyrophagus putrescentiae]KAH9408254.1 hypothetical protein TYRP_011924 [Tyrophagus putrescentiae]